MLSFWYVFVRAVVVQFSIVFLTFRTIYQLFTINHKILDIFLKFNVWPPDLVLVMDDWVLHKL